MQQETPDRGHHRALLDFAVLVVGFALLTVTRADADLWGHLRFGLDILRDRQLTSVDPYSFTQDKPWVNHEWLSELMMGLAWAIGGQAGLITLKAGMLTAVVAVAWQGLRGVSHVARVWIMVALAFGTIHMTSSIRPQIWTILALAWLCRTLAIDSATQRRWIPLLFAVWVNCHGGWIVGLGILGLWGAVDSYVARDRMREWGFVIFGAVGATLVNPYGWGLWRFIAETVRVTRDIAEWGPLWGTPLLNWVPWAVATIGVAWAARQRFYQKWPTVAVLAMLAYASLRVMRIESIYITASAILLARVIRMRWPARTTPLITLVRQHSLSLATMIVVVAIVGLARSGFRTLGCISVWPASAPDQLVQPSLMQAEPGRLVTFFDWGQYGLWHFGPRLRVSIDGRRETVYTDRRLEQHAEILAGSLEGLRALDEWRPEYVWLPSSARVTEAWLLGNGYRIDVRSNRSYVAVRRDLPILPAATNVIAPSRGCFPG